MSKPDNSGMTWRKSSRSGNGNCVETAIAWQKSLRSGNGNCVEVATIVRDAARI